MEIYDINDVKEKATLLSLTALIAFGSIGIASYGFGYIATKFTFETAFILSSVAVLILLLPSLFLMWKDKKSL